MKKLLLVIIIILGLLVAAILVGPSMVNWNNYKADLTNEVERLSGRKLTINGDIEISILPAPAVVAHNVFLSNSVGASAKNMFSLRSLEVRVALGPLLSGQVKVQTVRLIDPVIELQRFADGHTNLDFFFNEDELEVKKSEDQIGDTALAEVSEDKQLGESKSDFSLDNFSIKNARLTYRDDVLGRVEKIENFDANFAAASPVGPFASAGNMVVGGFPLDYTISIDRIIEERTAPISLTISLDPGQTKTSFSGAIIGLDEVPRFEGLVKTTGKNLAELVQFSNPKLALPGLLGQEFGIEARIAASAEAADISELSISLGNALAKGSAGLNVQGTPNVNINLEIDSIDLDKWLALPTIRATVKDLSTKDKNKAEGNENNTDSALNLRDKTGTKSDGQALMPDLVDVTFNITAKSLAFNNGLVRQARLSAELSGGEVTISHASANLPGNADVALFGFVLTDDLLPSFDGKMEVSVGNVRGMMNWLDAPMPSIPADRLLKMAFSSNVLATRNKISLSQLDLQFDSSRLTGKAALYLGERLSIDGDITLDRFNLDAYLGGSGNRAKTSAKLDIQDARPASTKKSKLSEAPSSTSLAILKNFDANIKSKIKTLVYGSAQVKNTNLNLSLLNGTVNVHQLSIEKLAGSTIKVKGSLSDIDGIPKMRGFRLDAKISDLSRLFHLLGKNISLDPKAMGTVALSGKIDGSVVSPNVELEMMGAGANITTNGKLSFLPLVGGFKGNLKVVLGDLVSILKPLGINYRSGGKLGAFDLDSKIQADYSGLTLSNLKAHLGSVPLNGTAKISLGGPRTKIEADLSTGSIAINRYLPVPVDAILKKTSPSALAAGLVPKRLLGETKSKDLTDFSPGRWPTNPIDLSYLENFDANLILKSEALVYGMYSFNNSILEATVVNGVLQVNKLSGELFDGTINATATAKAASPLTIESAVSLNNLSLEKGLLAAIGESPARGRAGMDIKLAASGYTISDLVAALNGSGSIGLEGITVSGGGRGTTLSSVIGLISELNNIGGALSGKKSSPGLANITGSFNVNKGIAQSSDLLLASSMGNGQAQGKIDLSRWLINVAGQFELSPNLIGKMLNKGRSTTTKLPFFIRGDLNAPNVKLNTSKLLSGDFIKRGLDRIIEKKGIGGLLQNIIPGLGGPNQNPQPSTPSPEARGSVAPPLPQKKQQQVPPKDFFKNLLNGLGR